MVAAIIDPCTALLSRFSPCLRLAPATAPMFPCSCQQHRLAPAASFTQLLAAPFLWARFVVGGAIRPRQAAASKSGYRPVALRLRACAFRDASDELAHLEFVLRLSPELIAVWAWSGRWRCGGELAGRGPSANRLATGAIGERLVPSESIRMS